MRSTRQQEILVQMHELRRSGTNVARQIPSDIRRAKDWREYVRAMPLPSALGAACLGFAIMYARSSHREKSSDLAALGAGAPGVMPAAPTRSRSDDEHGSASGSPRRSKGIMRGLLQTAGSWAAAYAVSQATQLAQQVAAQQLQVFKTGFAANVHSGRKEWPNDARESPQGGTYDTTSSAYRA